MPARLIIILFFIGLLSWSCTQHSTAPANVAFHNMASKYNALLQAREKLEKARKTILENRVEIYTSLLPAIILSDSLSAVQVATQLDSVIKKASLVAERHQNSKWMDDAYLVIGQARLLQGDYKNAVETFKYINTNYPEDNARPGALIGLMRAYTEQGQYSVALRVADLIRALPLSKQETIDYYLTKVYLHQLRREYAVAAAILEETLPLMHKSMFKARTYYVLGQLYELTNKHQKSIEAYAAVRKNRPSYDLAFYADLNSTLSQPNQNPQATFAKMLKDRKNADLQDQIYVAMASYEERQGNIKEAVVALKKATRLAQPDQVAPIYLKIADLSYNPLQDYEMAQAYYDSTVASQPRNLPNIKEVIEKKRVLDQFVVYYRAIKLQDSLQQLATMNPAQLNTYLEKVVAERKQKAEEDRQRAEEQAARSRQEQLLASTGSTAENTTSKWYFYNPSSIQKGQQEFQQKWGVRKLEDNWRRSRKAATFTNDAPIAVVNGNNATENGQNVASTGASSGTSIEAESLKKNIPLTPEALASSKKKQEIAYFELGKIYKLGLNESEKSIQSFQQLLTLFPQTEYEAEALYFLYLLHEGQPVAAEYKNRLFQKYADSYFARMINRADLNPLTSGAEAEAQKLYADAYETYQRGEYSTAQEKVTKGLKEYAGSTLEDKFALLSAMLTAKTQNSESYQKALTSFLNNYPNSPLISLAQSMLTAAKSVKQ
ncbi:MAG: tetratricopeptide repeat protein [Siphonobacter sp.]